MENSLSPESNPTFYRIDELGAFPHDTGYFHAAEDTDNNVHIVPSAEQQPLQDAVVPVVDVQADEAGSYHTSSIIELNERAERLQGERRRSPRNHQRNHHVVVPDDMMGDVLRLLGARLPRYIAPPRVHVNHATPVFEDPAQDALLMAMTRRLMDAAGVPLHAQQGAFGG